MARTRPINVRLIHDGVQPGPPLPEALRFGLQDSEGEVHPGVARPDGAQIFDLVLDVKAAADRPVLQGRFVHGPPACRFLYLGWKRLGVHAHPWGWRIKIPLAGIGWTEVQAAEARGVCVAADVIGRRPHSSAAIVWKIEPMEGAFSSGAGCAGGRHSCCIGTVVTARFHYFLWRSREGNTGGLPFGRTMALKAKSGDAIVCPIAPGSKYSGEGYGCSMNKSIAGITLARG